MVKKPKKQKQDFIEGGIELIDDSIKKIKKKISLFYKVHFLLAFLISLILIYFLILVPMKPKSIPYITQKATEFLRKNVDSEATIEDSLLSFTPYGTLRIAIINLKLKSLDTQTDNKELSMPKIESEFSLLNLVLLNYTPYKVKITDAKVVLVSVDNKNFDEIKSDETIENQDLSQYFQSFIKSLVDLQKNGGYAKNLEIENAILLVKKSQENSFELLIKNSRIKINTKKNSNIQLSSSSVLTINGEDKDVFINNNCVISSDFSSKCAFTSSDFNAKPLATLCDSCAILENINGNFSAAFSLETKDSLQNIDFQIASKEGNFLLSQYFKNKIAFDNLLVSGNYSIKDDALNISNISSNLEIKKKIKEAQIAVITSSKQQKVEKNVTSLKMSLSILGLRNKDSKNTKMDISLKNVKGGDIENFWPLTLPKQDIRDWVATHLSEGLVSDAFVKLDGSTNNGEFSINELDSQVNFQNLNVNYSDYFPTVTNVFGIAAFSKNSMKISIASGDVLSSKISNSRVDILNFEKPILEIQVDIAGDASNALKHANFKSKGFVAQVEKYLNGNSLAKLNVKVPLYKDVNLNNVYIAVNLLAKNTKSKFFEGEISIDTKKDFLSDNFVTLIDFTNSKLNIAELGIKKDLNIASPLKLTINTSESDKIAINNISLTSENKKESISGNLKFSIDAEKFTNINLGNNFGKNNYKLSYKDENDIVKISLKGQSIDFLELLSADKNPDYSEVEKQVDKKNEAKKSNKTKVLTSYVAIKNIRLANGKYAKNLNLNLNCRDQICQAGSLSATYGKENKQIVNLAISKGKKEKNYSISGNVFDVGYLAESLNISDKILSGNAKIKIEQQQIEGETQYLGNLDIKNNITFYESKLTKKLEKNDLFSKIKDKIFSNNKTTFDTMTLDFTLKKQILSIDSFIANNYKIGITAKGKYNIANNSCEIKGMIVPGFIINNLFGIGKIPLLGGVISGLLTGGEGGGLFGIKYEYKKLENQKEAIFETFAVSAFVPVSIRNLFDWD